MQSYYYDTVVVGSGVAGLICALGLSDERKVALVTSKKIMDSNSSLAQGGICVMNSDDDLESFMKDTMKAGHYENTPEAVKILCSESRDAIRTLEEYGVKFDEKEGTYCYTKEGGHTDRRIVHIGDYTGRAIMEVLEREVRKRSNIEIMEDTRAVDLLVSKNKCRGIVALKENGEFIKIGAKDTVLATGGLGGLYKDSTNYRHIRGDGTALAVKHNIPLKDISYVQFHPTSLYEENEGRRFLISESVRGEGALLKDAKGQRFTDELKPRDVVTSAVRLKMAKDRTTHVDLDITPIGNAEAFSIRFPTISLYVTEKGIDLKNGIIPVVPAQHYTMGGIKVDMECRTSMKHLYAVGEAACTGVHGKNRLASNSLLEGVVFSKRAALAINRGAVTSVINTADKGSNHMMNIRDCNNEVNNEDIRKTILSDVNKPESLVRYLEHAAPKIIMEKVNSENNSKAQ